MREILRGPVLRTLWRTVTGFDHAGIADFRDMRIVLMPGNGIKGQFGLLVLNLERAGVSGNLNVLSGKSGLRIEAPPAKANVA